MNATVAGITFRAVIGSRRVLLLLLLPVLLIGLAILLRAIGASGEPAAVTLLSRFSIGALMPLLGLIIGTGVIATEIDDGVIIYLLATPVSRPVIVHSKLGVAVTLMVAFAALPTLVAGLLLTGTEAGIAASFAVGVLVGGTAYSVIFLLISVLTRHAVAVGVIYALVWEGVVGGYVPGAQRFSVQQWALSIADALSTSTFLKAPLSLATAVPALILVTAGGTILAGQRLRSLSLTGEV